LEEINIPKIKKVSKKDNQAIFVVEPYFPGYGVTVGNSIRRVLLTSLPGAAIVAVKISGAEHEFSTLPGIKEDVIEIVMNLKGVRIKLNKGEEKPIVLKLRKSKSGPVLAKDIAAPPNVEITNPDHRIATIGGKGKLEMEMWVERGRGYSPSEKIDEKQFPVGAITMDASFSPVENVSFQIENTRVGEVVNYDRLILSIKTDGTITPEEALKESTNILMKQIGVLTSEKEQKDKIKAGGEAEPAKKKSDPLSYSVDEINLSVRTANILANSKIKTVGDIVKLGKEGLKELKGLGGKAYDEISKALLKLKVDWN